MTVTKPGSTIWRDYETDGVPASGQHDPIKRDIRVWSAEIEDSVSNGVAGAKYKFGTSTNTAADPGSGYFDFNIASPSPEAVTEIAISDYDVLGRAFANFWQALDDSSTLANRATIIIRDPITDDIAIFRVTGAVTDAAGWTRIPVEWVEGSGTFVADQVVGIVGLPTGDEGGTRIAVPVFDPGTPVGGEILWAAPLPAAATFLAGLTESFGTCVDLPTADAAFSIRKAAAGADPSGAVEFATATYPAGTRTATFACAADTAFNAGDVLVVVAPDPKDATLTRPSLTIVGHIS